MRTITHFLARKGVASTSTAFAVPTPTKPGSPTAEEPSEPTLADIGARVGEENETLRNLLIDTDRRIGALDDLKDAFRNLVEPIGSALQALEQEKSDNVGLRNALAELRVGHESVRSEFSALEKRAAELESVGEELRRELTLAQQAGRGLESDKTELTSEIVAVRAEIANLESQLAQETANGRALSEANQILVDHANSADKLLAEVRQTLAARTEDIRVLERKAVEATIARNATEKVVDRLTVARDGLDTKTRELEQTRASLTERSSILAETLKARETALAHAEQKIKSLTDRIAEIEVDAGAYRAKTERRIDELNASLQRERVELAVAQGALETTRRDYARLQRDILAGRGAPQRSATLEEVSDTAKEPSKSRNGRGGGRGPKAVEAEPEGGEAEPPSTR